MATVVCKYDIFCNYTHLIRMDVITELKVISVLENIVSFGIGPVNVWMYFLFQLYILHVKIHWDDTFE